MNSRAPRNLAIVLAGALIAIALVIVGLTSGGGGEQHREVAAPPRAPAPVVVHGPEHRSASVGLSEGDRASARRVALAFVRSYLPVLYGQAQPRSVTAATVHLRRSLRDVRQPPRAVRRRHPRLQRIELTVQTSRSVLASATVRDGVAPPFGVIFTLERHGGRWIVSDLASD